MMTMMVVVLLLKTNVCKASINYVCFFFVFFCFYLSCICMRVRLCVCKRASAQETQGCRF